LNAIIPFLSSPALLFCTALPFQTPQERRKADPTPRGLATQQPKPRTTFPGPPLRGESASRWLIRLLRA
jgi:hypothetical protein